MVKNFGFSTVETNLLTIPVWAVTAICIVIAGVVSDRLQQRGWPLIVSFVLACIGYAMLLGQPTRWVQFVATLFIGGGTFPQVVLVQTWLNSNMLGYTKKYVKLSPIMVGLSSREMRC